MRSPVNLYKSPLPPLGNRAPDTQQPFSVVEATIEEMQRAMSDGTVTSRELVQQYLERIGKYEGTLNAVMTLNSDALEDAEQLDRERAAGHIRGPLHGIPISVKDNIHTADMPTTGGMLAFKDYVPSYEATVVKKLREAGAIIIAKANMVENAGSIDSEMPMGFSVVGGQTFNPYDPRKNTDGTPVMDTSGSSSGSAAGTAANFWAASVGTETNGSILGPSNNQMLVGIRPTPGLASRHGIMPLVRQWDSPGPLAKSVADAVVVLGAMDGPDVHDPDTRKAQDVDYSKHLRKDGLKGARIGIPTAYFDAKEIGEDAAKLMQQAIAKLSAEGATIVPVDVPILEPSAEGAASLWPNCWTETSETCSIQQNYSIKRDMNEYFKTLGPSAPVRSVTELRNWNLAHQKDAIPYGQDFLDVVDSFDLQGDKARFEADTAKDLAVSKGSIDAAMDVNDLDALFFPADAPWDIASRARYPSVTVPFGTIPEEDSLPKPFGVSFTGKAFTEPRLIELAYAFEQATKARVPPPEFS